MVDSDKIDSSIPLGKSTEYVDQYDASLLFPIPRQASRDSLGIGTKEALPFMGEDLWTAFELSWLDERGKPMVAVAECRFPCSSPNIVESKSFKLYLNSFNQSVFDSADHVQRTMVQDLSSACGTDVDIVLMSLTEASRLGVREPEGVLLDDLPVTITHYTPAPQLLSVGSDVVTETLISHLLKTNCPVTGQPDWATVIVEYSGAHIAHERLLQYIVSLRQKQDFHEHCVEQIFTDILQYCKPQSLTVYARYTRRGGLDINPLRSTQAVSAAGVVDGGRLVRQ